MFMYTVKRKKDDQIVEVLKSKTRDGFKFNEKYNPKDQSLIFELSYNDY